MICNARPAFYRTASSIAALLTLVFSGVACAADQPVLPDVARMMTWTPEEQVVGFRNMEKIIPARVVKRGAKILPLSVSSTVIAPTFSYKGTSYTTDSYMKEARISGLLVIKNGKIVLERYGLGRNADDRWTSFSVAKSVTSTLVGAAIKDGYIHSLNDPVTKYIPQLVGSAYEGTSIQDLLMMKSGIRWREDYSDPESDIARAGWLPAENGVSPIPSYMAKLPRVAPPGAIFNYSTGDADLAGILVSNATGKPLADYLSEKIWAPLGMEQDAAWITDTGGHERGGICISMTLRDYGRLGLFMLGGGKIGARNVLPTGWVADATRNHMKPSEEGYGYFWWMMPHGYAAEGIFGQALAIFPEDRLVVVINSALPVTGSADLDAAQVEFIQAIRRAAH